MNSTQEARSARFEEGSYLALFFAEKEIASMTWTPHDQRGALHIIDTEVVIEHIAQTGGEEREVLEEILRQIDFANGDVLHFSAHLAEAIANR